MFRWIAMFFSRFFRGKSEPTDEETATPRQLTFKVERRPNYLLLTKMIDDDDKTSNIKKWNSVKCELFNTLFENKAGSLFTISKYTFSDNYIDTGSVIEKNSSSGTTYILSRECWTREELEKVATSMQFELEDVWMRPDVDSNLAAKLTPSDVDRLWSIVDDINALDSFDVDLRGVQAIGGAGDGDLIFWTNPSPEKVDEVLANLKRLCFEQQIRIEF